MIVRYTSFFPYVTCACTVYTSAEPLGRCCGAHYTLAFAPRGDFDLGLVGGRCLWLVSFFRLLHLDVSCTLLEGGCGVTPR